MTTNEQRDTAAILQMAADLDEARGLLSRLLDADRWEVHRVAIDCKAFLARTKPKHGETK